LGGEYKVQWGNCTKKEEEEEEEEEGKEEGGVAAWAVQSWLL
jgi:hypothetical protein